MCSKLRSLLAVSLAVALGALLLPAGAGASLTPGLRADLRSLAPGKRITVIVTMRHQAAVDAGGALTRRARVLGATRLLRDVAATSQKPLRRVLARRAAEGKVKRVVPFWVFDGLAVTATADVVRSLAARPDVAKVSENTTLAVPAAARMAAGTPVEPNVSVVNAPAMWDAGFRGQGVVVASLDTGVDVTHPDLAGSWRGGANSWFDPNGEHTSTPTDVDGHGTSTMGVIVGGAAGGSAIGVAPGAQWIAAKIFNDHGVATAAGIHQAFQWVLDPDRNPATADAPSVVNNSWTLSSAGCDLSFQLDLRSLRAAGILPVFAAGNAGPGSATSVSPGNNPEAFAVGAVDVTGAIDSSTSRGPSSCGEPPTVFPELVAPGVNVRSADLFQSWRSLTGTSMAAPHVSGALALLASASPGTSPDRQASALQLGAVDLGAAGPDDVFGSGELNVSGAYSWLQFAPDFTVSASPASSSTAPGGTATYDVSVGSLHGFGGDVSLSLAGLTPAQAGWSFSPAVVGGGSGTARLTVTTAAGIAPGSYPLRISGAGGGMTRTATVSLEITGGPPDFTLAANPPALTVSRGATATFLVDVGAKNGFAGSVTLAAAGVPTGAKATFLPNPLTGSGRSTLSVKTVTTTRAGSYTLTITGTSGALRHQATVKLTVR
jgi:subtilisin family serine protease